MGWRGHGDGERSWPKDQHWVGQSDGPVVGVALVAPRLRPALLAACALLLLGAAGCGGSKGVASTESPSSGSVGTESSNGSMDTIEEADGGSFNPLVKLCKVSELNEAASTLYPGQHIKCYPGTGTPTPIHQVSSAAWTAGEVDPATSGIADEHTIQVIIEGDQPARDTTAPHLVYGNECPSETNGVRCEDQTLKIEGTDCLMRKQVVEVGGPTITGWQVGCYVGHDTKADLDVGVQTAATKLSSSQGIEDFTAAAIRAVRG